MFGQQKNFSAKQEWVEQIRQKAAVQRPVPPQFRQPALNKATAISPAALLQPATAKQLIQKIAAEKNRPVNFSNNKFEGRPAELCKDTSYVRLLSITNAQLYVESVSQTSDHGLLVTALMTDTTKPNYTWRTYGLLIKMDESANILWIQQFEDLSAGQFNTFFIDKAFELSNNDIICIAMLDTNNITTFYNTVIYRLTSQGNVIWQHSLKSNIGTPNGDQGTYTFDVNSVVDGLNGDVILAGTCYTNQGGGRAATVLRLTNQGIRVWDANYRNYGADNSYYFNQEGIKAFLKNGNIVLVGISQGSNFTGSPSAVTFLTLDYATGNELAKRLFRPDYPADPYGTQFYKSFTYWYNECTLLSNGHIIVHGKLYGDFGLPLTFTDYFGVLEFDQSFNLLDAYTVSSGLPSDYFLNKLHFDRSGKALVSVFKYGSVFTDTYFYFAAFEKKQFQKQRKISFSGRGFNGTNGYAYLSDTGYAYIQSMMPDPYGAKTYIEFRKMHNSDTNSVCLGSDTMMFQFIPLNIQEALGPLFLDINDPNKIQNLIQNQTVTDTLTTSIINPCKQINYCDTVKIHGDTAICGGASSLVFTSFKNAACGGITQWYIDSTAIDSMKVLTDSSVAIWFKNVNWQGQLLATLPAGACYLPARDSVTLNILRQQVVLDLGPDTVLCPNNSITLNAHTGFATYRWQDGSTDSTLKVAQPGKYWVDVTNACGNSFTDTIVVSPYPPIALSLGPDLSICPNENITITAPPGFINYRWSSTYTIPQPNSASITVSPALTTDFNLKAEKLPGCFAYDTIKVVVQQVPPVRLGNDTSFCAGQSITLNAGAGYDNYSWNTGQQTQQITVTQKGNYIATATLNNCFVKDTLEVISVYPLPVFTLGDDTSLCEQTAVTLVVNLSQATYLWNNGSTNNSFTISQPGTYWLKATQNGCSSTDTIKIAYTPMPFVNLGPDTTLCQGQTILLDAANNGATYLWSNGTTQSTLLVSTPNTYRVAASIGNCTATDDIVINYLSLPQFTLGRDTFICTGQQIVLSPVLNTSVSYLWQDGSTNSIFTISKKGLYRLLTTNRCGSFADEILVTEGLCNIIMPNAFSPNGDGVNEVYRVKFPFPVQQFTFSIYNRFGEKVFETKDVNQGWDGKLKGVKQPIGNYVWTIQFTGVNNRQQSLKGNVLLLR